MWYLTRHMDGDTSLITYCGRPHNELIIKDTDSGEERTILFRDIGWYKVWGCTVWVGGQVLFIPKASVITCRNYARCEIVPEPDGELLYTGGIRILCFDDRCCGIFMCNGAITAGIDILYKLCSDVYSDVMCFKVDTGYCRMSIDVEKLKVYYSKKAMLMR